MRRHHQDQANSVGRGPGRARAYLAVHWPGRPAPRTAVLPYSTYFAAVATRRRLFPKLRHVRYRATDQPDQR